MKFKPDLLSILGLMLAVLAIVGGQALAGGALGVLVNGPAAVIVMGGTMGAAMLQTPTHIYRMALQKFSWIFFKPVLPFEDGLQKLVRWSSTARRAGLLGLEEEVEAEDDEFSTLGLNLLVDGAEPEAIRNAMITELDLSEENLYSAARVFEAMGGYSPTMGIVGAVLGLIDVMGNLSQPDMLGTGIATAFVATIYGVAVANLFFIPIAHKLKHLTQSQSRYREMFIEGIIAIAEGDNPRIIESRLSAYVAHNQ